MRGLVLHSFGTIITSACLVLFALPVGAEIYKADLYAPDDMRLIRDTESRLDWLRLHETAGVDMTSILAGHGGWVDSGWRYATHSEACEMLSHVFETEAATPCVFTGDRVGFFFDLFGVLAIDQYPSGISYASWVYFMDDDPEDPLEGQFVAIEHWEFSTLLLQGANTAENTLPQTDPFIGSSVASFLVRSTPAPVSALGPLGQLVLAGCVLLSGAASSHSTRPWSSARPGRGDRRDSD